MNKPFKNNRLDLIILALTLAFAAVLFTGFKLPVKTTTDQLVLRDVPLKVKTDAFYVADLIDARTNKQGIGQLIPVQQGAVPKLMTQPVELQGGLNTVENYLKRYLPFHSNYKPVIIKVNKFAVNEMPGANGAIEGKVELAFSFNLKTGDDMSVHLVNYNGNARYLRNAYQQGYAEPVLRAAIENALIFFSNWMDQQADTNPMLAKEVKVVFSDYTQKNEDDTIYYDKKRPLTWTDFKDHPRSGIYEAEVIPGLGYNEQTSIKKGVIYVHIAIKVFLPKSASWVRDGGMSDITLNHEQRHFDIVKIVAERFKEKLMGEKLPVFNYDGYINSDYFDALREMDKMQRQYDGETTHGINMAEQQKWNEYIDKELKKTVS